MKPVAFDYYRPDHRDQALDLLAEYGADACLLAGGMSLGAMLNMRLVRPAVVIDLNHVAGLDGIEITGGTVSTGAMVRQAAAMGRADLMAALPLLKAALPHVGHYQTRGRGTLGGSVAHADPSAEIPLVLMTLDGAVTLRRKSKSREVKASDFYLGVLTTTRQADEMVTGLVWPRYGSNTGFAFEEFSLRRGDYAIVAAAARAELAADGRVRALALGLGGVEDRPILVDCARFADAQGGARTAAEIAAHAADIVEPVADLQANADYRRQLVRVLAARVLAAAFTAARTEVEA